MKACANTKWKFKVGQFNLVFSKGGSVEETLVYNSQKTAKNHFLFLSFCQMGLCFFPYRNPNKNFEPENSNFEN